MKKLLILLLILMNGSISFAQDFNELKDYEFNNVKSYKTEQNKVLSAANYLFETPASKENELNRLIAVQYIFKWMEGTPDYTFELGEEVMELTKGNSDLLGLYIAALAKVSLENEGKKFTNKELYSKSESLLVNYCSNKDNNMKPSKKIKAIIKEKK